MANFGASVFNRKNKPTDLISDNPELNIMSLPNK